MGSIVQSKNLKENASTNENPKSFGVSMSAKRRLRGRKKKNSTFP